ncbi:MAG: hypothetical protein KDA89_19840 [Planctomycetaceae bacterium]|nr:hypothetical protein [Planctomycetaceae bacterium]
MKSKRLFSGTGGSGHIGRFQQTSPVRRTAFVWIAVLLTSAGCQGIRHELQTHRLWRLNYQEPMGRTDGVYFSVADPLDQPIASPIAENGN